MPDGSTLLTPKGRRVLTGADAEFAGPARDAIQACAEAMDAVKGLDLESHELMAEDRPDLSTWDALAPEVALMLQRVRQATQRLRSLFPEQAQTESQLLTADIDAAFSFGEGTMPGAQRDDHVERVLSFEPSDASARVGGAVKALTTMLDTDILRLGQELRRPEITSDRWRLLGSLHEMRSNSAHCLDALLAAIMKELSSLPSDQLVKGYANATRRALRLRADLRDLELQLQHIEAELREGRLREEGVGPRVERLLEGFSERPSFDALRPSDRKIVLELRSWALHDGRGASRRLEDLRRFLELMEGVNRRDVLMQSDEENVGLACMLLESDEGVDAAWPHVKLVYGRDPALDELIRAWRQGRAPEPEALMAPLIRLRSALAF
ncbi:MAG: hypothetical protein AAGD10_13460 [Myxococcota bacterium]